MQNEQEAGRGRREKLLIAYMYKKNALLFTVDEVCQNPWFLKTKERSPRDGPISPLMVMAWRGFVASPERAKGTRRLARVSNSRRLAPLRGKV